MSVQADTLAEELRGHLSQLFHIAVRVREIKAGLGYRIFQVRKTGNRHLVDIRSVSAFPQTKTIDKIQVLSPAELIASKVVSHWQRRGRSKSWTDRRDLTVLLLAFPDLKVPSGPVLRCLMKLEAGPGALKVWHDLAEQDILPETEDDDF
jgi:hypothetical protein